jgi:ribosome-associated protein
MESRDLALFLADRLSDKKGIEITILDVHDLVSYTDYFVIASGKTERQVGALAEGAIDGYRAATGRKPVGSEGVERGQWALIDFGDVVVHVFREPERAFYDLEGLWEDAPRVDYHPPEDAPGQHAASLH